MSRTLTRHATVALHRRDHRRLTPDKNKRRLPVRQQAGSFASLFAVRAKRDDANGNPNRVSNRMAMSLRTSLIQTSEG